MKFHIIASGSKGNATLIEEGSSLILIDMGIAKKILIEELNKIHKQFSDIKAVFFTHEHSDHLKGRDFFDDSIVYSSLGTTTLNEGHDLNSYQSYRFDDFLITPIDTSHDAYHPLGFVIETAFEKLTYITDTGYISEENISFCKDSTYYIIESNHNVKMLLKSHRSPSLKQRILSDIGHLSNEDSASYICQMIGPRTKQIYLAHISEECNTPELALASYIKIFKRNRINIDNYLIKCSKQYECVDGGNYEN